MPESVTDRPTKAHEQIFLLAKGQWVSRVIQFCDLPSNPVHLLANTSQSGASVGNSTEFCIALASAIFDLSQREDEFCLPPFYEQVWQQGPDGRDGDFVRGLPVIHRASVWAARFLTMRTTTKCFMEELNRLGCDLTDSNHLLIGDVVSKFPMPPSVYRNTDGTIAVNDSGKICKIDFAHNRIVVQVHTTCKYYYDADAIKEQAVAGWNGSRFDDPRDLTIRPTTGRRRGGDFSRSYAEQQPSHGAMNLTRPSDNGFRNRRSVWEVATMPYAGAHFATFPQKLIEPMILAGSRSGDIVFDPFVGSGTVVMVARGLGRVGVGCDLKYQELSTERIYGPLFAATINA